MNRATLRVCKSFLESSPPDRQNALFLLLPEKEQSLLQELPSSAPLQIEHLGQDILEGIHFTWIAPYLRTLAQSDIRLFLSALSKEKAKELQTLLGFKNHLSKFPKITRQILRKFLLDNVRQNQSIVAPAFLPDHPMNRLLSLAPEDLAKMIRYLGLHDLSFEMRQIIATATLKKIFAALPKDEGEYLQKLLLHLEPLVLKRLFLEKWDGSNEHLRKLVEERGLHRLSQALYGADPDLLWYITHRLDMHLGTLLIKYKEKPTHERAEEILSKQIDKILQSFNLEGNV